MFARNIHPLPQRNINIAVAGLIDFIFSRRPQLFGQLAGEGKGYIFLLRFAPMRARVDAAMAGINNNHWLGIGFAARLKGGRRRGFGGFSAAAGFAVFFHLRGKSFGRAGH